MRRKPVDAVRLYFREEPSHGHAADRGLASTGQQRTWAMRAGALTWRTMNGPASQPNSQLRKRSRRCTRVWEPMFWDTQSRRSSRNYPSKSDRTPQLVNEAKLLDRHYIPTRYTNSHPEGAPMDYYTRQDALEALRIAEKVQQYCEDRIRCTEKKS
jgi:hypothetical protein